MIFQRWNFGGVSEAGILNKKDSRVTNKTPANHSNAPKVKSETPSCTRDYSDSRPLEKMEIDAIANTTGSLEAKKTETQNDSKPLLKTYWPQ